MSGTVADPLTDTTGPQDTQEAATPDPAPGSVSPLSVPIGCPSSLKVIFWNSNCWNSTNCEKISETAKESDADIICITDARSDEQKSRYLNGYLYTLKRITGKSWRGKIEFRPNRRSKCSVGGDIIFFSDRCSKVVKLVIAVEMYLYFFRNWNKSSSRRI